MVNYKPQNEYMYLLIIERWTLSLPLVSNSHAVRGGSYVTMAEGMGIRLNIMYFSIYIQICCRCLIDTVHLNWASKDHWGKDDSSRMPSENYVDPYNPRNSVRINDFMRAFFSFPSWILNFELAFKIPLESCVTVIRGKIFKMLSVQVAGNRTGQTSTEQIRTAPNRLKLLYWCW